MAQERELSVKIVLLGLPPETAENLGQIITKWGAAVYVPPVFPIIETIGMIEEVGADVVFVWTGNGSGASLYKLVRRALPKIPVVALNLHAEHPALHAASEPEADDRGTWPFNFTHIRRLLHAANQGGYSC
jgi:hypothetical protein